MRAFAFLLISALPLLAAPQASAQPGLGLPQPIVEKTGKNTYRLGKIQVDTAKREVTVSGHANDVRTLEFLANTVGGMKAYESALTLDADAVSFNAALLLIGLDVSHARVPIRHFDPATPAGDAVEIWVDLPRTAAGPARRIRAEQLVYDTRTGQTMPDGQWLYTGSRFAPDGRYLAELDGVLIGFVHSPAPIIEHARGAGINAYGMVVLNPNLHLDPAVTLRLTVAAVGPAPKP
jgi:hypothetical protein